MPKGRGVCVPAITRQSNKHDRSCRHQVRLKMKPKAGVRESDGNTCASHSSMRSFIEIHSPRIIGKSTVISSIDKFYATDP